MSKYAAKQALLVDGVYIRAGEKFESDQIPGKNWEPLDKEGRAAWHARHGGDNPDTPDAPKDTRDADAKAKREADRARELKDAADKAAVGKPSSTPSAAPAEKPWQPPSTSKPSGKGDK